MNVVDSSAWIEYLTGGPNARFFSGAVEATDELVVPTLTLFEVFKRIRRERDDGAALHAVAHMMQGTVADLTASLALDAARISAEEGLPMADAIIYATALAHDAVLWTQDSHFRGRPGVEFRAARSGRGA